MPVTRSLHFTNEARSAKDVKGGASGWLPWKVICVRDVFASLPSWARPSQRPNVGRVCGHVLMTLMLMRAFPLVLISGSRRRLPRPSPSRPPTLHSAETLAGARSRRSTVATVAVCCDSVRLIVCLCARTKNVQQKADGGVMRQNSSHVRDTEGSKVSSRLSFLVCNVCFLYNLNCWTSVC